MLFERGPSLLKTNGCNVTRLRRNPPKSGADFPAADRAHLLSEERIFQTTREGIAPALRSYRRRTEDSRTESGAGSGENRRIRGRARRSPKRDLSGAGEGAQGNAGA